MDSIDAKRARLLSGAAPRVLDCFSGCGGFSLGLQRLGWTMLGGVEHEAERARTYAWNLHRHDPEEMRQIHAKPRDMLSTEPRALIQELSPSAPDAVDIIVGGPPCQAYARVGRAKLREIAEHPEAFLNDERGQLYAAYVRYVKELQPLMVIMENVPEILNYGGENIGELAANELESLGYVVRYTLLNAAWYGVPQTRERFFLLGYHRSLGAAPTFPAPTHTLVLPPGYAGARGHALKLINSPKQLSLVRNSAGELARPTHHYVEVLPSPELTLQAVGCEDALGDLPVLLEVPPKGAPRKLGIALPYRAAEQSVYRALMRHWPGFESSGNAVTANVCRYNGKDRHLFERLHEGADYPAAVSLAEQLLQEELVSLRRQGHSLVEGTPEYLALREKIVPCYDPSKFPNRWRKLERRRPARTLMSHLKKDCYSHIHYDDQQARTVTVREAARLQSFPDGFEFPCSMVEAFGQIGNAVPPLLSWAIGQEVQRMLDRAMAEQEAALTIEEGGAVAGQRQDRAA